MQSFWKVGLCFGVLSFAGLISASATFATQEEDAVAEVNAQFYSALNAMFEGDSAPMEAVWSHADDVTYMGPSGGKQVGWDQVRAYWQMQAANRLGGQVNPKSVEFQVGTDIATTSGYEEGENHFNGETEKVSIRATNIYRKENGQWKMIGHHTDLLPYLEKN